MSWLFNPYDRSAFHDKAWKRADMARWDQRWAGLSPVARRHFVEDIKAAVWKRTQAPTTPAASFPAEILAELQAGGLIVLQQGNRGQGQVVVPDEARGFAARLRALRRYHLLDAEKPSEFITYVGHCFSTYDLDLVLGEIIEKATGSGGYAILGNPTEVFVRRRRWPDWVCDYLNDPLARPLLDAVESAGGAVPLSALATRFPDQRPDRVRDTLDALVNHLALVEDLDSRTYEIVVGLQPAVRSDRERGRQQQVRPPLEPAALPVQLGPEGGVDVPDLRAVLLELAGERARLRQDHSLFQKDHGRFLAVLEPLPRWLTRHDHPGDARLQQAWRWARHLGFVHEVKAPGGTPQLELSTAGQRWLALGVEEQHRLLYDDLRESDPSSQVPGVDDVAFLGSDIIAVPARHDGKSRLAWAWFLEPADRQPLRSAVHRAFASLPVGVFFRVGDFLAHTAHGLHNPLYLGGDPGAVVVRVQGQHVPPIEEQIEDLGRRLIREVLMRLAEMGAVQLGHDAEGQMLLARRPRLDVYFGGAITPAEVVPAEAPRVVVQPDFSVIIIGMNLTPAAELAPFCDRVRGSDSQGALTFRLSRESIQRGLAAGLTGDEVLARLGQHSSTPVPQNVLAQVRSWCDWVRTVTTTPAVLFRCPDPATADRVLGVLGKRAERLDATVVALPAEAVTPAVKQKLHEQGILLAALRG